MEPGQIQEFLAVCDTCNWHGRKYGSQSASDTELKKHISLFEGHEGKVTVTEVNYSEYPELSKEAVKLLFIRKSAGEAYASGEIKEATKGILIEVVEVATASSMSNDALGELLRDLEKARSYLAAFTQGLEKAHTDKLEPEFREKREKVEKEKRIERAKKAVKTGDLSDSMKALGLSMDAIMLGVAGKLLEETNTSPAPPEVTTSNPDDYTCPKCQKVTSKQFYALHVCS